MRFCRIVRSGNPVILANEVRRESNVLDSGQAGMTRFRFGAGWNDRDHFPGRPE